MESLRFIYVGASKSIQASKKNKDNVGKHPLVQVGAVSGFDNHIFSL